MGRKGPIAAPKLTTPMNFWDAALGVLACLIVVLTPLAPDEKLLRLKMQTLELGIAALLTVAVLRMFVGGRSALPTVGRSAAGAVLLWTGLNVALWVISSDRALAS